MKKTIFFGVFLVGFTLSQALFSQNKSTSGGYDPSSKQQASKKAKKTLVVYFSVPETDGVDASSGASRMIEGNKLYGTTEYMARVISEATGGDLFEIKTVKNYPTHSHKTLVDYAKKEADSKTHPKLQHKVDKLASYDIIFIGYPNWWYDMPMAIYSFLQDHDFSGKTLIPFCTHGGSGFSQSVQNIARLERGATVQAGPAISRSQLADAKVYLLRWLKDSGFTK